MQRHLPELSFGINLTSKLHTVEKALRAYTPNDVDLAVKLAYGLEELEVMRRAIVPTTAGPLPRFLTFDGAFGVTHLSVPDAVANWKALSLSLIEDMRVNVKDKELVNDLAQILHHGGSVADLLRYFME